MHELHCSSIQHSIVIFGEITKMPRNPGLPIVIIWVIYSIFHNQIGEIKRTNSLQASCIHAKFSRIRPSLMVGVYPTMRTKIVFYGLGMKPVHCKLFFSLYQLDLIRTDNHCTFHSTIRAIAANCRLEILREVCLEPHGAAVALALSYGIQHEYVKAIFELLIATVRAVRPSCVRCTPEWLRMLTAYDSDCAWKRLRISRISLQSRTVIYDGKSTQHNCASLFVVEIVPWK